MDLKKDKQKIYSIEAEYYKEHMRENSQVSVSQRLNNIIKVLMVVLLMIVSFFVYKIVENNISGSKTPAHSNKSYVDELASNKSVDSTIEHSINVKVKKVVMGVSIVSPSVEQKSEVIPVATKMVEKELEKNKTSTDTEDIGREVLLKKETLIIQKEITPVVNVEKEPEIVENIEEKKSMPTDILSVEYLKEMENALKGIE